MASQGRLGTLEARRRDMLDAYDILDTPPDRDFNDLVKVASEACGAPISLISLLDLNRLWFKAEIGFGHSETPLSTSICVHAVQQDDLFVINDTREDPRTANNPFVTGAPHLRFYAGMPLRTPEGVALGTLCVLDTRPRELSASQAFVLRTLARQVMTTLELRRALSEQRSASARHRDNEQALRLALRAARLGSWQLNLDTGELDASDHCKQNFGRPVDQDFTHAELKAAVHPADRERMLTAVETAIAASSDYNIEYRIIRPDGTDGWVMVRAQVMAASDGAPRRMVGVSLDITERMVADIQNVAVLEFGDRLRDLTDRNAIIAVAADTLARAFRLDRACYASVDFTGEVVTIDMDWYAPDLASIAGQHRFQDYGSFGNELRAGGVVAVGNVRQDHRCAADAARWTEIGTQAFLNVPVMERGRLVSLVVLHARTPRDWTTAEIGVVRTIADRVRAAIARTDAEEQRRLLNLELDHRMKNLLSIVQGIANQTLRTAPDVQTAKTVLSGRLVALGRAHDFVFNANTGLGTASLKAVVEGALVPHRADIHAMITTGPEIEITGKAALSVSLVLHELATNAVKYGALSQPGGQIDLRWTIQHVGPDPVLRLDWTESGGPPVTPPARKGFGTRLIERGFSTVALNQVNVRYEPEGFTCSFTGSLEELQADHTTLYQRPDAMTLP